MKSSSKGNARYFQSAESDPPVSEEQSDVKQQFTERIFICTEEGLLTLEKFDFFDETCDPVWNSRCAISHEIASIRVAENVIPVGTILHSHRSNTFHQSVGGDFHQWFNIRSTFDRRSRWSRWDQRRCRGIPLIRRGSGQTNAWVIIREVVGCIRSSHFRFFSAAERDCRRSIYTNCVNRELTIRQRCFPSRQHVHCLLVSQSFLFLLLHSSNSTARTLFDVPLVILSSCSTSAEVVASFFACRRERKRTESIL